MVLVEIAANPGHCDDEGEDGEADYERDLITHDAKQVDVCKRKMGVGERSPGIVEVQVRLVCPPTCLGVCSAKIWGRSGRDYHARDKAEYMSLELSHFQLPIAMQLPSLNTS